MNKRRKGYTLVEVLVSIVVFTIIVLSLLSTYIGMRKIVHRQEEYIRLEMVAHDINYYWDMYGTQWDKEFFNHDPLTDSFGYHGYLDKAFSTDSISSETSQWQSFSYRINYTYDTESGQLIITSIVSNDDNQRVYLENVNCGTSALYATQEAPDEETP